MTGTPPESDANAPDPTSLAASINRVRSVADGSAWLVRNAAALDRFDSIEDWVNQTEGADGFGHHLAQVRHEIVRHLWEQGLYVAHSVVDELLFQAVARRDGDPTRAVLEWLFRSPLVRPTYVIYPLHSFGSMGAGLTIDGPDTETGEEFARRFGVVVSKQHNDSRSVPPTATR